jgi:hypothetical protein
MVKVEPSADQRAMAKMFFQMFVAFVDEGFTERQALIMIGQIMAANRPEPTDG